MDVRALREMANMTQVELASMTGIPRERIAKWEQGKGVPKAADQKVLESYFGKKFPNYASVGSLQAQGGAKNSKPQSDNRTDKLTTVTTRPDFEMRPATNGAHTNEQDAVIAIRILAETSKIDSETISKLTDLVTKLIKK